MNKQINNIGTAVKLLALAAAMAAGSNASAQSAGAWLVSAGVNKITPKVTSENVTAPALPESKADVGSDTKPVFNIAYMYTNNVAIEIDLGVPYKHTLYGDGALKGTGELGTAEVLPPTMLAQYRFFGPKSMFRPYVGLGVTYAYFQKERGSAQLTSILNTGGPGASYKLDNKFAVSGQLGTTVAINERWFGFVSVIKTKLKTTAHYSTGQTMGIRLDPLAVSAGIGYAF